MGTFAANHWIHHRRPKPKKVEIKATPWSGQVSSVLICLCCCGDAWISLDLTATGLCWMSQCLSDLLRVNFRPAFLAWSVQTSSNQTHFFSECFCIVVNYQCDKMWGFCSDPLSGKVRGMSGEAYRYQRHLGATKTMNIESMGDLIHLRNGNDYWTGLESCKQLFLVTKPRWHSGHRPKTWCCMANHG